ncbi:MAG: hypothetical protein ACM3WV_07585 [Bacillota bacterium]
MLEPCISVNPYYIESRYPIEIEVEISFREAEQALQYAEK